MASGSARTAANAIPVFLADGYPGGVPPNATFISYQQIADLSGATILTPPAGATMALVQVNAGIVRYRRDGGSTPPTGDVGMLAYATGPLMFFSAPFSQLDFIQNTGSTASLNVEWYGPAA